MMPNPEEARQGAEHRREASSHERRFLESASAVLEQRMSGITVRESGSLRLFNAERILLYKGYNPNQECLKGLICRVEGDRLEIIAPCLPKFYNLGEQPHRDQELYRLLQTEGAVIHFPEKVDGTNIRFYINPDTGEIAAATRGMIDGGKDEDDEGFGEAAAIHFGREALAIAREKFSRVLDAKLLRRFTPVFELIHPENRIVTNYGDTKDLVLLSVFDKERGCRELTREQLEAFAERHQLHLVETWSIDRNAQWDEMVRELAARWKGTDKEGTVVTVERDGEVALRMKVKSQEYLALMRVMKQCTLGRTEELADAWGARSWEVFREKLFMQYPDLPEEVAMGYETHFRAYEEYMQVMQQQADETITAYEQFIKEHTAIETQKDFALAVQERPDKSLFFLVRKLGVNEESRQRIIAQLRKQAPLKDFVPTHDTDAA